MMLHKLVSEENKQNNIVVAELINENNEVIDESIHFFETPKKLALTKPYIDYNIVSIEKGKISIEVKTDVLAKDV